ncbi:MAG TPA: hypothetical protein PKA82_00765 [Pyrinomonadaceae bacterium]|nr:hypothetical protein [Pyrinomonadaceae bacterium]
MKSVALRTVTVWLSIILAETLNGIVRELFITPQLGDISARRVSFGIALVLILAIAYLSAPMFAALTNAGRILVGIVWSVVTLCFEVFLIGSITGISTERIIADYDPRLGGLMAFGMLYLIAAPTLGYLLRRQQAVN